jgi:signal transduction histidine kinase
MRGAELRSWLPLPAWAGLLSAAAVLVTTAVAAAGPVLGGGRGPASGATLAAGALIGLLLSSLSVLAAGRPSRELEELSRSLEALTLRVRVADELGERHRREAAQAGAGVQELLSGLVAAEEGVRGQLAAELHDTVAQSLMTARGLLAGPLGQADLARVRDYVEDAEEQLRAAMARARPPALRDGDLAAAVESLRVDLRTRYALEVHLTWPKAPAPLPLPAAITIYRFFQEALLNVVKHADVDEAAAELRLEHDAVVAIVRDAGAGFEPDQVRPDRGRHVGLGLLSERARLSGGWLEVRSGDPSGTVLQLRLPRRPHVPALVPEPAPAVRVPAQRRPSPSGARSR